MLHSTDQAQLDDLLLDVLPGQGSWSDEDYLWLTDHTNRLIELTEGFLEVLPMPTDGHQTLLLYIYEIALRWCRAVGGKVLVAPLRLRIQSGKFREPDLLLVLDARDPRRADRFWSGADLVVEVVSPDRPERDLVEKRADYAAAGIPEYWIVEPADHTLRILTLVGSAYREAGLYQRGQVALSIVAGGLELNVDDLFTAD